jgi:hypothetical protein
LPLSEIDVGGAARHARSTSSIFVEPARCLARSFARSAASDRDAQAPRGSAVTRSAPRGGDVAALLRRDGIAAVRRGTSEICRLAPFRKPATPAQVRA